MLNYKNKLILAYFNNVGDSYSYRELIELFGLTTIQLEKILEDLIEREYLIIKEGYILTSKAKKILEEEKGITSNIFENDMGEEIFTNRPLDFSEVYIPKNFDKKLN